MNLRPGSQRLSDDPIQLATDSSWVAAVLLLRADGAALLQHRDSKPGLPHASMWVPPGGHCEPGEPLNACARRELLEETAYDCPDLRWLLVMRDSVDGEAYPLAVFWAPYDERQVPQCLEGQALQFVSRARAADFPIPEYLVRIWDFALEAQRRPSGARKIAEG